MAKTFDITAEISIDDTKVKQQLKQIEQEFKNIENEAIERNVTIEFIIKQRSVIKILELELIKWMIDYIEESEFTLEHEFGRCRDIQDLIDGNEMPDSYYLLKKILESKV